MEKTDLNFQNQMDRKRLILLGLGSVTLLFSRVFALFTPVPLVLAFLLKGRLAGSIVMLLSMVLSSVISVVLFKDTSLVLVYSLFCFLALSMYELIIRKFNPMKIVFILGTAIVSLICFASYSYIQRSDIPVKVQIQNFSKKIKADYEEMYKKSDVYNKPNNEYEKVLTALNNPEFFSDRVIKDAPPVIFAIVFVFLWMNLLCSLKMGRYFPTMREHPHSDQTMIQFRMPDMFIFVVIAALVIAIWGDEFFKGGADIGLIMIKCMAVFYFFQGFGVYSKYLDFFRMRGFMRAMLMFFTVTFAHWLLVLVGLFDMFFDFRKKLELKEMKGE